MNKYLLIGAAVAALGLAFVVTVKKKGAAAAMGQAVGGAVVDAAVGVATGVVYGIGDTVGVPRTDMTECEKAKAEGRTWDASFACPAKDFISYLWD